MSAWAATPNDNNRSNLQKFFHNVEGYGRLGYSIGGTAPMGMPAEIRKLNKFILQPNVSFGADLIKPASQHWGVLAGIHFENKAMHIDATVKNYHMQITQGGQTLEGRFTGKNDSHAVQWTFTIPVQAVYKFNDKWKLKFGPYFSYVTSCNFDGFAYDGYLRVDDPTGAKVLLGSATPSLESFYLAKQGKYGLVRLTERHAGVSLPKITLVPTKDVFSPELVKKIGHTLQQGQQAILFQNRRGYSSQIECVQCGWTPHCPRCDVSLTYHKRTRALECHYCGYRMPWPQICPQCEGRQLETQGYGTERIEEGLQRLLPIARPIRMDTDSTSTRKSYERIIQDFEQKKCNVLIGTQMVTKGLDFSSVQTVGILSADGLMNFPDFRAHERAFQLMEQVAGRAGRREGQQGEVIIQCRDPKNLLLQQVVSHDYLAMAESQLEDRRRYGYPPFTRLIIIYMKGRYEDRLDAMVAKYVQQLRYTFGERVLGPEAPPIGRVKNMFIRQVLLKVEREASTREIRRLLGIIQNKLSQDIQEFSRIVFYYDVDPM